jgi:hypothetical protein
MMCVKLDAATAISQPVESVPFLLSSEGMDFPTARYPNAATSTGRVSRDGACLLALPPAGGA